MATHISSAEPQKLFRYSDFGTRLDHDLIQQATRLVVTLQQFEATCTEPGFQMGVSHLGDALRSYGASNESVDLWVCQVGRGFQMADWVWTYLIPSSPAWGLSVLPVLPGLTAVALVPLMGVPDWLARLVHSLPWLKSREGRVPPASWLRPEPERAPPKEETEPQGEAGTKTAEINQDAPTDDCVKFIEGQRDVPPGFTSDGFYSGKYKGESGYLDDGTEYGQVPRPGAIMVESPNPNAGIDYGHASYVYEVEYDDSGKAVSYKVVEGNWPTSKKGEPPPLAHCEEFRWDDEEGCYVSDSGKRRPDMFIY